MDKPIARTTTFDGKALLLWADGLVTFGAGFSIPGVGASKIAAKIAANLIAGWWLMGDGCLYEADEVSAVLVAARKLAARNPHTLPGDFRAHVEGSPPSLRPIWTVIEADRDGKPRVECWRLPRLWWPGLAVGREAGRYSVWTEVGRTGTYGPTGVRFSNLRDLGAYLESCRSTT